MASRRKTPEPKHMFDSLVKNALEFMQRGVRELQHDVGPAIDESIGHERRSHLGDIGHDPLHHVKIANKHGSGDGIGGCETSRNPEIHLDPTQAIHHPPRCTSKLLQIRHLLR